jgi:hypothetical protein
MWKYYTQSYAIYKWHNARQMMSAIREKNRQFTLGAMGKEWHSGSRRSIVAWIPEAKRNMEGGITRGVKEKEDAEVVVNMEKDMER